MDEFGVRHLLNQDYPDDAPHESWLTKTHQAIAAGKVTTSPPRNPQLDAQIPAFKAAAAAYARGEPFDPPPELPTSQREGATADNPIDLTDAPAATTAPATTTTKNPANNAATTTTTPHILAQPPTIYCVCKSTDGSGDMIACEADDCPNGTDYWCHWECVGLAADPGEDVRWICPDCVARTGEPACARK